MMIRLVKIDNAIAAYEELSKEEQMVLRWGITAKTPKRRGRPRGSKNTPKKRLGRPPGSKNKPKEK
jgi:hypothetical protein